MACIVDVIDGSQGRGRELEQSISPPRPATVSVPALPTPRDPPKGSKCVDQRMGHGAITRRAERGAVSGRPRHRPDRLGRSDLTGRRGPANRIPANHRAGYVVHVLCAAADPRGADGRSRELALRVLAERAAVRCLLPARRLDAVGRRPTRRGCSWRAAPAAVISPRLPVSRPAILRSSRGSNVRTPRSPPSSPCTATTARSTRVRHCLPRRSRTSAPIRRRSSSHMATTTPMCRSTALAASRRRCGRSRRCRSYTPSCQGRSTRSTCSIRSGSGR
jgi:hypothetical protein